MNTFEETNQFVCELGAEIPGDNAGRTLRSFTYQALGQLAARQPQLFARDTSAAARFFQVQPRHA